jgi:hypothetical protein
MMRRRDFLLFRGDLLTDEKQISPPLRENQETSKPGHPPRVFFSPTKKEKQMGQNNMGQNNPSGQQGSQKDRDQGIKQAPGQDKTKEGRFESDRSGDKSQGHGQQHQQNPQQQNQPKH